MAELNSELAWRAAFKGKRVLKRAIGPYRDLATVMDSRLFDDAWYRHVSGLDHLTRREAAAHYLAYGLKMGFTPNPLFDGRYFEERSPELKMDGVDPFLRYVRGRFWGSPTHPLFPISYIERNPLAIDHSAGPIGHYLEFGAPLGAKVNWWLPRIPQEQPRGLVDWLWAAVDDYHAARTRPRGWWGPEAPAGHVATGQRTGTVSVVIAAQYESAAVASMVEQARAQAGVEVEIIVVPVADIDLPDVPAARILEPAEDAWAARNAGAAVATGEWLVFPDESDAWSSGRLALLVGAVRSGGWGHDSAENTTNAGRFLRKAYTADAVVVGAPIELGTLIVDRQLFAAVGGFNPARHFAAAEQLLADLARTGEATFVPAVGTRFDGAARQQRLLVRPGLKPWLDHNDVLGHHDEVLNDVLIDWAAAAERTTDDEVVTIIIPTYADLAMTTDAVWSCIRASEAAGDRIEIIVVDNGCTPEIAVPLASLMEQRDEVRVISLPENYGFALGNNVALAQATGSTIVFLNNDTLVFEGWLDPIREAMRDPQVLAAQSLLIYDTGAIQSAGVAFSAADSPPHAVLQGYPTEDARGLAGADLSALTGAALAGRYADLVRVRGFDAVFRNGMEDVDLCLRLAQVRPGACRLLPESQVIHLESRTPGRFTHSLINRKVFLDRWGGKLPVDDERVWSGAGYTVTGRAVRQRASEDNRVNVLEPVVERTVRASVSEPAPRLRWAIKNPAPYGPDGVHWGDTYYAQHLAESLERLGQDVIIDYRPEFMRESARHDDVVLLLRGLAPYYPVPGQVSMMWVISHPEMLAASDGRGWDRIYVASSAYAPKLAAEWGRPVRPLLQATDPSRFNPDVAEPDTGYPLLFLGSSRNQPRPMVMDSVERDLGISVIGKDWGQFVPAGVVRSEFMANDQVGAAYRSAGILLNDHWDDMREEGFISNRLFDAVAAGARVITDDVVGLREVFGPSVQVATTADELEALVRAENRDEIFGTDAERRAAAEVIAREHSFDARAAVLLEDAVASWRERQGQ